MDKHAQITQLDKKQPQKENTIMQSKRLVICRHGRAVKNSSTGNGYKYPETTYKEFINLLTNNFEVENNPLARDFKQSFHPDFDLDNIQTIYHSNSQRATETAELLLSLHPHKQNVKLISTPLIAEVTFYDDILSKDEYDNNKGLEGCRPIILERWVKGIGCESFEESLRRYTEFDTQIKNSNFTSVVAVTHGWLLRMIYMFYNNQIFTDNDLTLPYLLSAPIYNYGESFIPNLDSWTENPIPNTEYKKEKSIE